MVACASGTLAVMILGQRGGIGCDGDGQIGSIGKKLARLEYLCRQSGSKQL